jgi:outer membrane protein OmpA-like peptidoglycan-associated protein
VTGGFGEVSALKLSGGIVFRLGEKSEPPPLAFGCTVEPTEIYAGDPVVVTGSTMGLSPKKKTTFTWAANGGHLTPHEATANVDTAGLAPGEYTVSGHVSQGPKAYENATCEAGFVVRQIPPPTVTCMATPATATSGATIDISATGTSPTNRPLTYSYGTTAGTVSGDGQSAKLATAGLGDQTITVTCNVSDDLSQRASATAQVTISSPPAPVIPNTQTLCSLTFNRDTKRPARVDNEAKACLDDVALTLSQQLDAKLVVVGNTSPDEQATIAAERAMNARQYLTEAKGVEASRIELRVGQTSGRSLDDILVPSGATFNDPNTQDFDENAIQRHGEAYGIHHGSAAPIIPGSPMEGVSTPGVVHHRRTSAHKSPARRRRTGRGPSIAPEHISTVQPAPGSGSPVLTIPPLQ